MPNKPIISISHLQPALDNYYALAALARIWRRKGIEIDVGRAYNESAAVCILHHDRTKVTEVPAAPPGAAHVNAGVLDISKRLVSAISLRRDDDWPGPVIIKTNANHFGEADGWGVQRSLFTRLRMKLRHVSWRAARMTPPGDYPILQSIQDVPNWVWRDEELIVEKFLPERSQDGLYCLRGWIFLGDKSYGYRLFSPHPLVKVGATARHEYLDEAPYELTELRRKLKFDYGKFDYVVHGDKAIVFDTNRTPAFSDDSDEETPRLRKLADGIEAYL